MTIKNMAKMAIIIIIQEEINGIIEELLEEDEMDITDINNLIYSHNYNTNFG